MIKIVVTLGCVSMKISYCTNCHKRLWQLKQTLPHNLAYTKVGEVELCVLVYNDDTVETYLIEHYPEYISDGRLNIKTHVEDRPYSFGYVKTLSHAIGVGRVLFNLDADNYIECVHDALLDLQDNEILVTAMSYLKDGRGGRIGVTQSTYKQLGGYLDYQLKPDDDDFIIRAMQLGKRLKRADCVIAPIQNG